MSAPEVPESIVRDRLNVETNDRRFEEFCADLYSVADGYRYVPTSRNYDRGRDGRLSSFDLEGGAFILCSTRKDFQKKADQDYRSLVADLRRPPERVRFCFTREVTEAAADQIRDMVHGLHRGVRVQVEGQTQIYATNRRHPDVFRHHYRWELEDLRRWALDGDQERPDRVTAMRVALTTQLSADATELREAVSDSLILAALSDGAERTAEELATRIASDLGLAASVQPHYLVSGLERLRGRGQVEIRSVAYRIAPPGRLVVGDESRSAARAALEQRGAIRRAIEAAAQEKLTESAFARVWDEVQDTLTVLFMQQGVAVTATVAALATGRQSTVAGPNLQATFAEVGRRLRYRGVEPGLAERLAPVLSGVFSAAGSPGHQWLTHVSLIYLTVCSLGLLPDTQAQVVERLRRSELLLDTDIVLSFLCRGEDNHPAVAQVLRGWRKLGGRLVVPQPVLEEAAYHAWIGQPAYAEWWSSYRAYRRSRPASEADRLSGTVANAYVRGFLAESDHVHPGQWRRYIGNFCGCTAADVGPVARVLAEDGIDRLPDEAADPRLARVIADDLSSRREAHDLDGDAREAERRGRCDGRLLALLFARRTGAAAGGTNCMIVSSSTSLRAAAERHLTVFAGPTFVTPLAAIAFTLALVPGVNVTLASLRSVLFGGRFRGSEALAARLLRSQGSTGASAVRRAPALEDAMNRRMFGPRN